MARLDLRCHLRWPCSREKIEYLRLVGIFDFLKNGHFLVAGGFQILVAGGGDCRGGSFISDLSELGSAELAVKTHRQETNLVVAFSPPPSIVAAVVSDPVEEFLLRAGFLLEKLIHALGDSTFLAFDNSSLGEKNFSCFRILGHVERHENGLDLAVAFALIDEGGDLLFGCCVHIVFPVWIS